MMRLYFRQTSEPVLSISHFNIINKIVRKKETSATMRYSSILAGFVMLFVVISESYAGSQLMVIPKRIVFSKNMRSAQVTIMNSGDAAGTYRISLTNKRMSREGRLEDVKTAGPGELFADKIIRFSPRQVVLEPGKSQIVRLGLRKPSGLEDGEYRSHMLFRAIPLNVGKDIQESIKPSPGMTIKLTAIVGISIPIIIRHGKTDAEVSIVSARLVPRQEKEDQSHIVLEFERRGNRSVYGDLLAEFITKNGDKIIVAQVGGIAVYTPGVKRSLKLPVVVPPGVELSNGNIQVFYRSPMEQGGKVMAQTQIKIP